MTGFGISKVVSLPEPRHDGGMSVEKALGLRRSVRKFSSDPLTIADISQLLWAAQGVTSPGGYRTAPSAGALYPLEVYAVVGNVRGLSPGIYKYLPRDHALRRIDGNDRRDELCRAALGQTYIRDAAVVFVICAVNERVTGKYGARGNSYVLIEVGHAAQNISLQAVSLQIENVVVGAFHDHDVKRILKSAPDEDPLYILPVGHGRE